MLPDICRVYHMQQRRWNSCHLFVIKEIELYIVDKSLSFITVMKKWSWETLQYVLFLLTIISNNNKEEEWMNRLSIDDSSVFLLLLNAIAMATRCVLPPVKLRKWIENENMLSAIGESVIKRKFSHKLTLVHPFIWLPESQIDLFTFNSWRQKNRILKFQSKS